MGFEYRIPAYLTDLKLEQDAECFLALECQAGGHLLWIMRGLFVASA